MAYWDDEQSVQSSQPIELHEFYTTTEGWYYADGLQNKSFGGDTYVAATIKGEKIEQGQNAIKNRTKLRCDYTLAFAWQYIELGPDETVYYNRYRLQGSNYVTVFKGTVLDVQFERTSIDSPMESIINIDPYTGDMQTGALVLRYSRNCPVPLYHDLCGVDEDDALLGLKVSGNLVSVSGFVLTATELGTKAAGFFTGGDIYVNGRRRKIVYHTGSSATISSAIPNVAAGQAYTARAGCDHTPSVCETKFDNLPNCKAHPNIPEENPYSADGMRL